MREIFLSNKPGNEIQPLPCPASSPVLAPMPVVSEITPLAAVPVPGPTIKIPVVLAEPTLQIVVESNISLSPVATEIKRLKKMYF